MNKNIKKTVRFSEEEFRLIEMKLKENNLDFASLVREALLKQKIKFPLEKEILFELNNININLEALAKKIYTSKFDDKKQLLLILHDIETKLNELV